MRGKVGFPLEMLSVRRSHHLCGLRQSGIGTHRPGAHDLAPRFPEGQKIDLICALPLCSPVN